MKGVTNEEFDKAISIHGELIKPTHQYQFQAFYQAKQQKEMEIVGHQDTR